MKHYRQLFVLAAILLIGNSTFNKAFAVNTCNNATSYFYINGVSTFADTNRFIAADSIRRLLVARGTITTEIVTPLRNPSDGLFIDVLVELSNQKLAEKSAVSFADAILKSTLMFSGNPAYAMTASDRALLDAKIADYFNRSKNLPNTTALRQA